jgi:two-component system, response regulator YesN
VSKRYFKENDMSPSLQILIEIMAPTIAGLLFLGSATYFLRFGEKHSNHRLFGACLFSFGVFFLARPLQLLLAPHPAPLIIVCLRFFLMNGIFAPLVLLTSLKLAKLNVSPKIRGAVHTFGWSMAILYAVAMISGTNSSVVIFMFGDWPAHENIIPAMKSPWYWREVSQLAQILPTLTLGTASAIICFRGSKFNHHDISQQKQLKLFALGILLFVISHSIGGLTKNWWIYYLISVPSALLMSLAMVEDIQQLRLRSEKVLPFLRNELLSFLRTQHYEVERVKELLRQLNKSTEMNVVWVFCVKYKTVDQMEPYERQQKELKHLERSMEKKITPHRYLILAMESDRFALLLDVNEGAQHLNGCDFIAHLMHSLNEPNQGTWYLGQGKPNTTEQLQTSFLEANNALRYAIDNDHAFLAYEDIKSNITPSQYPFQERDEFLRELKNGDLDKSKSRLKILLDRLQAGTDIQQFRSRALEVLGLISMDACEASKDPSAVTDTSSKNIHELFKLNEHQEVTNHLLYSLETLYAKSKPPHSSQPLNIVTKAKAYIEQHYQQPLTRETVASHLGVSASHLDRLCKEQESESIPNLITQARLNKAEALLKHSDSSITQIAFEVGFKDANYFSTVFKKNLGVTPKVFRNRYDG